MRLNRISKYILFLIVIFSFVTLDKGNLSKAENRSEHCIFLPEAVVISDSVRMDTTGRLPFPFSDKPAFGFPDRQDTSSLFLKKPDNIGLQIEYDPVTGQYVFYEKIGNFHYRLPQAMSVKEYIDYDFKKSLQDYWRQRKNVAEMDYTGSLIPRLTIKSEAFDRIFGGNTINIRPQGYVEVSFGYQMNATENPAIPERLRKVPTFDFDQKIQMSVMGQIGTKMNMRVNYNTEATFDYENKINLEHTGDDDDIIKRVEAGNVSLPLSGSLITGASNLFGVKTEMQFGKLTLTTLFSQHKGETRVVETEGGAQVTNFDLSAADYDANRHFFLSQYFRDHYDEALQNLPVIRSGITINKIEVWVTNKSNNFTDSRNILALQDLGEHNPHIYNSIPGFQQNAGQPSESAVYPHNHANGLYREITTTHAAIRNNQSITTEMAQFGTQFMGGRDFEKIEQARKLNPSEYTVNLNLGYISLNTSLNNDEVLAVAYNYTVNGQVFQVGEFSSDGVDAPQTLVLKLIKGTNLSPGVPTWDLMMKNVYNLNAYQLTSEDFMLNVMIMNDSTGTYINYLPETRIRGHILLNVLNLDKLNKQKDPYRDGVFDYIEGVTVNSSTGRIIFPVLEPFGKHLADSIGDAALIRKYTFQSLYDSTRTKAEQDAEHNKFKLIGSYKGSSSSDISVGAFNLSKGSVKVTAGGRTLTENVDYTVDYTMGRVTVINPGLLEAGTPIQVSTESEDLFSMQRKTLLGAHANYAFSDRFNLGATALYMQERPLTQKVDYGQDPISNLMLGLDARFSKETRFLTKAVDRLPFISTKAPSSVDFEAEIAQLIPGHSRVINKSGTAYIDDFEGTKTSIDLKPRQNWVLASTPQHQDIFPEGNLGNRLEYGFNRALLSWYIIDPLFLRSSSLTPSHIRNDKDMQSNHLVREVFEKEIFPAKESVVGEPTNISVLDLAFYPNEKGPYNYDTGTSPFASGVNPDGTLRNPASRWGGIMRAIENSDFETANIEFIEFWMMDPFVNDSLNTNSGGDLFFNLGDISEDILRDGRKSFENGLPTTSAVTNVDTTIWGRISTQQSLVNAFDNNSGARKFQDLGMDGINDDDERSFYSAYLNELSSVVSPQVFEKFRNDPSQDNYHYYRGSDYDQQELGILERYKRYNGLEGNSPTTEMSPESYPTSASTLPDMEDINSDNTLNEYERYYQYRVSLRREDLLLGKNHINDIKTSRVQLKNGQIGEVKWYQFKIPVREYDAVYGSISDFKSIRFLRMFLRSFNNPVVLRFATLDLVRADWRRYTRSLAEPGTAVSAKTSFDISAVNIEENGSKSPVNYILPPGIDRVIDPANPQLRQLNEQSMVLKVTDLEQGDARAAYKSIYMDFRRYKRLKLEIHAEEMEGYPVEDDELTFFLRLGTDYIYNYYEYEVPLKLTPPGRYNGDIPADRYEVWPNENRIDIPLELFVNAKLDRDADMRKGNSSLTLQDIYEEIHQGWNNNKNRIRLKGSPNLGGVQVMMMGIRHKKKTLNTGSRSVEVWVNELRLDDFDESGGWAANARVTARLADLGTITMAGRTRSAGFGSIDQNINRRSLDNLTEFDIATSVDLGRFFPKNLGVNIPLYYGYSKSNKTPMYDPLNPDIKLKESLKRTESEHDRDSIKQIAEELVVRKSLNLTNIRIDPQSEIPKPPKLWSPGNFALTYSYNEIFRRDINTEFNIDKTYRGMFSYNFTTQPKLVSPFSKVQILQKGPLKMLGNLNFYPLPSQISFRTDLYRRYNEVQTRNITNPGMILPRTYEKDFLWNRYFDLRYDLTRNLKVDFSNRSTSRIDEPEGRINRRDDDYEWKRDSIVSNLMDLGRPVLYNHNVNATYMLPINQIKMLNFLSASATYQGTYNWSAGPVTADTIRLGNTVENSSNIQLTGNLSLTSLYNLIPYLKKLETKFQNTGRSYYGRGIQQMGSMGRQPQQQPRQQPVKEPDPEYNASNVRLVAGRRDTIVHKLNLKNVTVKITDKNGSPIAGKSNPVDRNRVEIIPSVSAETADIKVIGKPEKNILQDVIDLTLRMATGIRNVSFSYSISGGSVLPGYLPEPVFFGTGKYTPDMDYPGSTFGSRYAPGLPFLLGWQDRRFAQSAGEKGWITKDPLLNSPFVFNRNERISIHADVEPLPDLRVDVNADRAMSKNLSEFYHFDGANGTFKAENLSERGNFSMSVLTWGTAFFAIGKEDVHRSEAFENLKENRLIIAKRLAARRPAANGYDPGAILPETGFPDGYGPTSVEVLVPAFLAAYQNIDPYKVSLGMFPSIKYIRPNWRVQYEGMISKIPKLNEILRTMSFTHSYRSSYNVGSFLTNLNYLAEEDGFSYVRDIQNNFLPAFEFNSVSITEAFNPLINMDITWLNDLTTRTEINRTRSISLSFSNNQLTEVLNNEYIIGVGYRFTRMDLILKTKNSQRSYSNDLTIRADLSFRKNKTILRRLVENTDQLTAGQNAITIKTTADYMLSDRFQLRLYYDKIINQPFVGSFETSNTNFGVSFRFTLAQ